MDVWDLHKLLAECSEDQVWPMALAIAAMCSDDEVFVDQVVEVITKLRKLWTQQDIDEQDPMYHIHRSSK
jgi:meiotically up-regulated gene 157 (Mug157) protein